jgi:hypothetical protein
MAISAAVMIFLSRGAAYPGQARKPVDKLAFLKIKEFVTGS